MDPPYVPHHHHPRYVPYSPAPPPPPPPVPFDSSPSFYASSRHHNHHLPPPPPLPQQQLSYQPSLPQPSPQHHAPYNPHHPQLTYNSSFNVNPQFSDFSRRSAPESPHAGRRVPEIETSLDYWSGNRLSWEQPASNPGRDSHYTQLDGKPSSPVNRYRHGYEGSSRFRNEYSEGFKLVYGERNDFVRHQDEYGFRDRSSGDFGISSSKYESGLSKVDGRYDSSFDRQVNRSGTNDKFRESARWVHDRQTSGGNEINKRDGMRNGSRKYDFPDSEVEIYDDKGRREDIYEVNRTPRKQIQKKSALLRIQLAKPNHRSREDERSQYSGYSNETRSNSFRGKDQAVHFDDRMDADEREGSPVELDVSFKSNSLVAKAITPPCSSVVASDTNLTPKNSKVRKVLESDKITSAVSPIDSDTGSTPRSSKIRNAKEIGKQRSNSPQRVNEAASVVHNLQFPEKNISHSEGKATFPAVGTLEDITTKPCPEKVKFSLKLNKNKTLQKAATPSDVFSNEPISLEDANRSEKIDASCSRDGEINVRTQPSSCVFNAAGTESIEGRPKTSVSSKANTKVGKTSARSAVSDKINGSSVKTLCNNSISGKIASPVCKTPAKSTASSKVGKVSAEKSVVDKFANNQGKGSTKSINSVKPYTNPGKATSRSTLSDKVVSYQAKAPVKNVISGNKDDNARKKPFRSTTSGCVDANPGKTSSVKIVKKKKVVRKVVKKVKNQAPRSEMAKVGQNLDNPLCADSSPQSLDAAHKSVMPVKKRTLSANLLSDGSPVHHVNLQDPSKDAKLLLDSKVLDNSLNEVGSDFNVLGQPGSVIHKKRKFLESVICLPNIEGKLDGNLTNADNSIPRQEILTPVQDATEAASQVVCSSVSMPTTSQLHDHGVINFGAGLLKAEKKAVNDDILYTRSSGAAVNMSGNFYPCLSNSEKIKCSSVTGFGLCDAEEINKFDEISTTNATPNHTSVDIHCQVTDGVSMEAFTVRKTNPFNSEDAEVSRIAIPSDCIRDGGIGATVTGIDPVNLGLVGVDSTSGDGSCGPLFKDGVVVFKEASGITGSSNAITSTEDQQENSSTENERKRRIELPMVELLSSQSHGVCVGSGAIASSEKSLNVTINFSDENLHPVEKADFLDGRSPTQSLSDVKMTGQGGVEQCDSDGLPVTKKQKLCSSSSSPTVSLISEMPVVGQMFETDAQQQTSTIDDLIHNSEDVTVSKVNARYSAANHSPVNVFSDNLELGTPYCLSRSPSRSVCDVSSLPVSSQNSQRIEPADAEVVDTEGVHLEATDTGSVDVTRCRIASPHQSVGLGERLTNAEDSDSSSMSKSLGSVAHGNSISSTSMVETLEPASDRRFNEFSLVSRDGQNSQPYVSRDGKRPNQKPQSHGACSVSASMPYSDIAITKAGALPSRVSKYSFPASGQMPGKKNQITHPAPNSYPGRNVFVASRSMTASNNTPKSRTWRRAGNSHTSVGSKPSLNKVPPQTPMTYKVAKAEASYIRKGNSLVRKASSVPAPHQETPSIGSAVSQLSLVVLNEFGKVSGTGSDVLDSSRTVGVDASTAATLSTTMLGEIAPANQPNDPSGNSTSVLIMEAPLNVLSGSRADLSSSVEINDLVESSKGRNSTSGTTQEINSVSNVESPCEQSERTMTSLNANNRRYIKLRSNQLVAADASVHIVDNNQSGKPGGYYKRSKNQLIRTSMEENVKWSASAQSKKMNAARAMATGAFGNRQPLKAMGKIHKLSRFSLVWTLKNARLLGPVGQSCYPKIFPQLFPWKRVSYWRSMLTSGYNRNINLSSISHKLLLLRKRNTVYTRSNNGFSLRKSKVLSVDGSSLKWSKSIERRSKKASEEATLAVAEAERKRKEQNTTASSTLTPNSVGHASCRVVHGTQLHRGERIFRIGSMRYKMDSSRRTLQRIPDDDITSSTDVAAGNKANKSYVPRRLVIGNDEYVRIGSGNQLIRNPKKRTRVLASEKVRWSLHTARQRLVKRRKYCQFFTRFGKCNKDNGKCPYIHDPSKIAVCTKFLKGLCSNPICKLTHKVLPERMPDCSYFLQGLCTNEICPYRHVHVNPNASTCEAFLRGYCADGNECRKKHSYLCPAFEATGSCPQGSNCKLHHPKKRIKEKRSKSSMERKNTHGRYFGSVHLDSISERMKMVSGRHVRGDKDESEVEEELGDFISIDASYDEDWKIYGAATEKGTFVENSSLDLESEDIDELIWPVRIMGQEPVELK